ncbi:hypothetical protein NDU88_003694 [Pleurodeles waltl]|uniref:Uncharacterized protein n=1 Tax=Pleurodeles waltl TaxID=8319 RepID=A0AAV7M450_PLEWA|nr:hypothetical protein NDU88_003694 [Pleurodeles waltl]
MVAGAWTERCRLTAVYSSCLRPQGLCTLSMEAVQTGLINYRPVTNRLVGERVERSDTCTGISSHFTFEVSLSHDTSISELHDVTLKLFTSDSCTEIYEGLEYPDLPHSLPDVRS